MRHAIRSFTLPTSDAPSAPVQVHDLRERTVHLVASDATLQLQGSIGGVTWTNIGAAVTTGNASLVDVPQGIPLVRVNVSAFASAGSAAQVAGFESQTSS